MDLAPEEVRVLGCLVEKEMATPQSYPLSLNSLRLACNQSTNRDPVVDYDDRVVEAALASLRERGLTRVVYSQSNRVPKYRHVLDEVWHLDRPQLAVLAVLALRGPQTLGELKLRTERMHPFADLAEVDGVLSRLAAHDPEPLAKRLERRPGQKDARYAPLLGAADAPGDPGRTAVPVASQPFTSEGPVPAPSSVADLAPEAPGLHPDAVGTSSGGGESSQLAALRSELSQLRTQLDTLRADFETFRNQFS